MPRKGPAPKHPVVVDPVYNSPLVTAAGQQGAPRREEVGRRAHCLWRARGLPGEDRHRPRRHAEAGPRQREAHPRGAAAASAEPRTRCPSRCAPAAPSTLALRWLVSYSRQRREKTMTERLMNELLDASNGLGASVKRREDTHKMAESNKAFAHYRW